MYKYIFYKYYKKASKTQFKCINTLVFFFFLHKVGIQSTGSKYIYIYIYIYIYLYIVKNIC